MKRMLEGKFICREEAREPVVVVVLLLLSPMACLAPPMFSDMRV